MDPLELTCEALRDPSLALRYDGVVGNDVDADGKPLIIITGANSGGKSTFLRSVGLAQLMMQCRHVRGGRGLRASVGQQLFTHFIREEDAAMVSGRLDEELSRMSAIADHQPAAASSCSTSRSPRPTSARARRSAARSCARCSKSGVRVVYVTHQFDFADSFHRQHRDSTLFLRAPRQPDGRRTFRLTVAEPLPTSYGEDIYHRIGGWLGETSAPG